MRIELPSGTPAELVTPEGKASRGLAICPDIMGLRPLFDDLCARLAADHGWSVCAIEPFPGRQAEPLEARLSGALDVPRLLDDLVAAADRTAADRVAVMGFCMGGMVAMQAAGTGRFDRAVAFYGMIRVPEPWRGPGGIEPLDALADEAACPTLAILGGQDRWTPSADIDELRRLGPRVEIAFYPEADHGFVHDPDRPAHRADDAADAWRRVAEFLA